jgi:hypothetical protein
MGNKKLTEFSPLVLRSPRAICALLFILQPTLAWSAEDTVRFFARAFIPKSHPTKPGAIVPVPGQVGLFMLSDPLGNCFDTDHREFSSDPAASARLTTDITVTLSKPVKAAATNAAAHKAGTTTKRSCSTGSVEAQATASVSSCSMGAPSEADGKVQLIVACSGGNPLVVGAPKIDYGGSFLYDRKERTVSFKATIGNFPAFEAYASLNHKPFVTIFAFGPVPASTPWALFDGGIGFSSRTVEGVPVKIE